MKKMFHTHVGSTKYEKMKNFTLLRIFLHNKKTKEKIKQKKYEKNLINFKMKLILFLHVLVYSVSHTRNDKSCIKIHKSGAEFVSRLRRSQNSLWFVQRECATKATTTTRMCMRKRKDDKKEEKRKERKKNWMIRWEECQIRKARLVYDVRGEKQFFWWRKKHFEEIKKMKM